MTPFLVEDALQHPAKTQVRKYLTSVRKKQLRGLNNSANYLLRDRHIIRELRCHSALPGQYVPDTAVPIPILNELVASHSRLSTP